MKRLFLFIGLVLLGACGVVPQLSPEAEVSGEGRQIGVTTDILVRPRARPAGLIGTAPQPEVVSDAPKPAGSFGETVASLGNPAEPGLWLKTPLVATEQRGRVRSVATGAEVVLRLLPLDGPSTAGSRISLDAMQALGIPLQDLPTLEVLPAA